MQGMSDDFLAAEEEAARLVSELTELKRQIGGYGEARHALGTLATRLGGVADRLAALTAGAADNINLLREVGAPQIREEIREAADQIGALQQELEKAQAGNASALADLRHDLSKKISGLQATVNRTDQKVFGFGLLTIAVLVLLVLLLVATS
jgi:chromosome segregation ATPase